MEREEEGRRPRRGLGQWTWGNRLGGKCLLWGLWSLRNSAVQLCV